MRKIQIKEPLLCPYCKYENRFTEELYDNGGIIKCESCQKYFDIIRACVPKFYTKEIPCLNGEGRDIILEKKEYVKIVRKGKAL